MIPPRRKWCSNETEQAVAIPSSQVSDSYIEESLIRGIFPQVGRNPFESGQ